MRLSKAFFTLALLPLLCFLFSQGAPAATLKEAMTRHLSCYPVELLSFEQQEPVITRRDICLASIYHETGGVPLWVGEKGPGDKAAVIFDFLQKADREGLEPATYQADEIASLWSRRDTSSLARLDTLLTYNAVRYLHDVSHGRLTPYLSDPDLFAEAGEVGFDPVLVVEQLLETDDVQGIFEQAAPQNVHYLALRKGLANYRAGAPVDIPWTPIPAGGLIRQGDSDERVLLVRTRLMRLQGEDLPADDLEVYDGGMEEALVDFQRLHGLKPDGIIGPNTIAELNVSPADRITQIKVNMARWRWQAHELGDDYILVNIAGFRLYGYRDGERHIDLPVIVGKLQHQTPVFSDSITYIEFNPFWNIPPSIAVKEDLPKLRDNPYYLVDRNIRLFSSWQADAVELDSTAIDWKSVTRTQMARYKLRQDPGPDNALGRMKFVFPNNYAVYLHDTPKRDLFNEHLRSFSHGCIRVFAPERLAAFILAENSPKWSEQDIADVVDRGKRKIVGVAPPMPVHLTYQTAWLDKEGRIHFNRDIYDRDEQLSKALLLRKE